MIQSRYPLGIPPHPPESPLGRWGWEGEGATGWNLGLDVPTSAVPAYDKGAVFLFFVFFFFFPRAATTAYVPGLGVEYEPYLQPTPQLAARLDPLSH